jgi:hypothetical protein
MILRIFFTQFLAVIMKLGIVLSDSLKSLDLSHFRMHFEEPAFSLLTADQN